MILGEGFDNLVLQSFDVVFRFPKRRIAITRLKKEIHVLSWLKGKLEIEVPSPMFVSEGFKDFPYPFYTHKIIKSQTASSFDFNDKQYEALARKLGSVLASLHSLPIDDLDERELEPLNDRTDKEDVEKRFWRWFSLVKEDYKLSRYQGKIENIMEKAYYYKKSKKVSLVHGDLYSRHIIVDKRGELRGLIDWGHTCLNDPVIDLAICPFFFPKDHQPVFWEAYGIPDKAGILYAEFLALYSATCLLYFAHIQKDKELILKSLEVYKKFFYKDST